MQKLTNAFTIIFLLNFTGIANGETKNMIPIEQIEHMFADMRANPVLNVDGNLVMGLLLH